MSKVVIVTGSSRGIGAAVARQAGREGYAVCVNYVSDGASAARVVADIEGAGGRAIAVQADVGVEADILRLFETTDAELGSLTALVNNAAITGRRCEVEDTDMEMLTRVFTTNIGGSFICAREALKRMSTQHGGSGGAIVNVSSIAARITNAFDWLHYGASKGAVDTFTRGMALEGAPHGVRCNAVRPGMTETDIHPADRLEKITPTIPLRRAAQPEEVAEAVMWLLSDKAGYCTGTLLDVAGGRM